MIKQTIKEAYSIHVDKMWKCRDFVDDVYNYLEKSYVKVFVVSGLRGTGKTCGVLQGAIDVDGYYYCGVKGDKEILDITTLIEELRIIPAKCIILDEYPWIRQQLSNPNELDAFLYTLVQSGKRVIITGTESVTLEFLQYSDLIHRCFYVHINYFSFEEYCKLWGCDYTKDNCEKFLVQGGVFDNYITSYESMREYVKSAIIDNLVSYFMKYHDGFTEEYIEAIVYSIFYQAICSSRVSRVPVLAVSGKTFEDLLNEFGINSTIQIDSKDFKLVSKVLSDIHVIFVANNYKNKAVYQTYLVNPSLSAQMIKVIYNLDDYPHAMLGYLYEASCAARLYFKRAANQEVYYMEGRAGGEDFQIDFILQDSYTKDVVLFECKLSDKIKIYSNASIVSDTVEKCFVGQVAGRYILGERKTSYECVNNKDIIYIRPETPIDYWDFENIKADLIGKLSETLRSIDKAGEDVEKRFNPKS